MGLFFFKSFEEVETSEKQFRNGKTIIYYEHALNLHEKR